MQEKELLQAWQSEGRGREGRGREGTGGEGREERGVLYSALSLWCPCAVSSSSLDAAGGSSGLELGISLPPRGEPQGPGVRCFPSPKSVQFS